MLLDLIQHKGYTDASLLRAIRQHDRAAQDYDLRRLLHHIILANRFWLMQNLGRPFVLDEESRLPESLEAVAANTVKRTSRSWNGFPNLRKLVLVTNSSRLLFPAVVAPSLKV